VQLIDLLEYAKCIKAFRTLIYANFNKPLGGLSDALRAWSPRHDSRPRAAATEIDFLPIIVFKEGIMYALIHSLMGRRMYIEQLSVFVASLAIAEMFYKFHSFTLECIAFLATWYVLELTVNRVRALLAPKK
jgi:hypothetical protein